MHNSYMAELGIRSFEQLVGRADLLQPIQQNRVKTKGLFSGMELAFFCLVFERCVSSFNEHFPRKN